MKKNYRHVFRENINQNIYLFICFATVVLISFVPQTANSASFDCKKAKTKIEKLICEDYGASKSDEDMDLSYLQALERVDNRQELVKEQRDWIKAVRNACQDSQCIYNVNTDRMSVLDTLRSSKKCYWLEPPQPDDSGKRPPFDPVCRILEENLNAFCNEPPMVCGLKVAPKYKDRITFPNWKPIANPTPALIEEFLMAPLGRSSLESRKKLLDMYRADIGRAFTEKTLKFSEAEIDLYNLGKAQMAFRLEYGDCNTKKPQVKEREDSEDEPLSPKVTTHLAPAIVDQMLKNYSFIGDPSDVFNSEGKMYDYSMGHSKNMDDYQALVNRTHEKISEDGRKFIWSSNVCIIKYQSLGDASQ